MRAGQPVEAEAVQAVGVRLHGARHFVQGPPESERLVSREVLPRSLVYQLSDPPERYPGPLEVRDLLAQQGGEVGDVSGLHDADQQGEVPERERPFDHQVGRREQHDTDCQRQRALADRIDAGVQHGLLQRRPAPQLAEPVEVVHGVRLGPGHLYGLNGAEQLAERA